jgi:hypothetical protein
MLGFEGLRNFSSPTIEEVEGRQVVVRWGGGSVASTVGDRRATGEAEGSGLPTNEEEERWRPNNDVEEDTGKRRRLSRGRSLT